MCVCHNGLWLLVDGKDGIPAVRYLSDEEFDLAGFYREQGIIVVETEQGKIPPTCPFLWRNCVGLVKAILCLRSFAFTPYQLYKRLTR